MVCRPLPLQALPWKKGMGQALLSHVYQAPVLFKDMNRPASLYSHTNMIYRRGAAAFPHFCLPPLRPHAVRACPRATINSTSCARTWQLLQRSACAARGSGGHCDTHLLLAGASLEGRLYDDLQDMAWWNGFAARGTPFRATRACRRRAGVCAVMRACLTPLNVKAYSEPRRFARGGKRIPSRLRQTFACRGRVCLNDADTTITHKTLCSLCAELLCIYTIPLVSSFPTVCC